MASTLLGPVRGPRVYFEGDGLDSVRAPKQKHIKQGLPNHGLKLNKRQPEHMKQGLFTKASAALIPKP